MRLRALGIEDMDQIREERNALPDGILRTPYKLTQAMQEEWYYDQIANRTSTKRYWGLIADQRLVGYGGIENIQWENGIAEMSLMVFKNERGQGFGQEAVSLFLDEAFNRYRLDAVYAEVYKCNPNIGFWGKQAKTHNALIHELPMRKYLNGIHHSSMIYTFRREHDRH